MGEAEEEKSSPVARKGSLLGTAKAVLWSFFGVRRKSDYESDSQNLNPVHVILIGIIGAALFVATLLIIVNLVVR